MNTNKPTLYLIRGVPGSGKSTLARKLNSCGVVSGIIEADSYFIYGSEYRFDASKLKDAHAWCQRVARQYLFDSVSVAVSNTSTTEKEVKTYQKIAEEYNANFVSIIVENRHECVNIHNVPEEKIQQMKDRFSVKL